MVATPDVTDYLDNFVIDHPTGSKLCSFLVSASFEGIEKELKRQVLPESLRETILPLLAEFDALHDCKYNSLKKNQFELASMNQHQQDEIAKKIRTLIGDQILTVTPALIANVLITLGFSEG